MIIPQHAPTPSSPLRMVATLAGIITLLLVALTSSSATLLITAQQATSPISSSSEIIPLYISQQLEKLAIQSSLFKKSTRKFINAKPISNINLFWRDTVGTAMIDTLRLRSSFPTAVQDSFFRARQNAKSMPFAYSPICLAVNTKNLPGSLSSLSYTQTSKLEGELIPPVSLNQLSAWLTVNNTILTQTGETTHPLLAVSRVALSKNSALGAVVVDALQQYSHYFPQRQGTTNLDPASVFPKSMETSNANIIWYDSDEAVEAALLSATTTTIGFALYSSSLAMNRPSNGMRCIPILDPLSSSSSSQQVITNASHVNSDLLTVKYQDNIPDEINLQFVVRRKYSSAATFESKAHVAPFYPFIAIIAVNVDSRTFSVGCSERATAIQDLFFNLSFADIRGMNTQTTQENSMMTETVSPVSSYAAAQNLPSPHQAFWPWTTFSAVTRNEIRLNLIREQKLLAKCTTETELDTVASTFVSSTHAGRVVYSFPIAYASSESLASSIALSELFFLDLVNHPLQGRSLRALDNNLPISNVFERPVLVVFTTNNSDEEASLEFHTSESNSPQRFLLPSIMSSKKTAANTNTNTDTRSCVHTPVALSQTCVVYNSDGAFSSSSSSSSNTPAGESPLSVNIPICVLFELLSLNSRTIYWNDARITEANLLQRQHIDGASFSSTQRMTLVGLMSNNTSTSTVERFLHGSSEFCGITNLSTQSRVPFSAASCQNYRFVSTEHELLETLLATPGSISLLPCSTASHLLDSGLLHRARLRLNQDNTHQQDQSRDSAMIELESPSDLLYIVNAQKRLLHSPIFANNNNDNALSFDSEEDHITSSLSQIIFDQVLGTNPSFFSVQSASLKKRASNAAFPVTSFSCAQLFSSARFLEWILSSGVGLDSSLMNAEILESISSRVFLDTTNQNSSIANANANQNQGDSIITSTHLALAYSSSSSAPFDYELINIAAAGSHLQQQQQQNSIMSTEFFAKLYCDRFADSPLSYRSVPPSLLVIKDPATSLTFKVGFPLGLILAVAIFIGLFYILRKVEIDDTTHAPLNAKRPIFIICVHVPLKEHLRHILGSKTLEKWIALYEKHLRESAVTGEVYVIKEGENSGFFLASKTANSAVEFAFSLHERLLERCQTEMTEQENIDLQKAYDSLKGPFSRYFAQAAPIRRNFRNKRLQSVNFPMDLGKEEEDRKKAKEAANDQEFEKGNNPEFVDDEDLEDENGNRMDREDPLLWQGLLVSVGVEVGPCDIHFKSDAEGYDYSGIPVEHADSLALIAAPGQTLISQEVMRSITRWFDMKRIGKITCLGDLDLGVMLPVHELFGGTAELVDEDDESDGMSPEEKTKYKQLQIVTDADTKYEERMRIIEEEKSREKRAQERLARLQKRYVTPATETVLVNDLKREMSDIPLVASAEQSMTNREAFEAAIVGREQQQHQQQPQTKQDSSSRSHSNSNSNSNRQQSSSHHSNQTPGADSGFGEHNTSTSVSVVDSLWRPGVNNNVHDVITMPPAAVESANYDQNQPSSSTSAMPEHPNLIQQPHPRERMVSVTSPGPSVTDHPGRYNNLNNDTNNNNLLSGDPVVTSGEYSGAFSPPPPRLANTNMDLTSLQYNGGGDQSPRSIADTDEDHDDNNKDGENGASLTKQQRPKPRLTIDTTNRSKGSQGGEDDEVDSPFGFDTGTEAPGSYAASRRHSGFTTNNIPIDGSLDDNTGSPDGSMKHVPLKRRETRPNFNTSGGGFAGIPPSAVNDTKNDDNNNINNISDSQDDLNNNNKNPQPQDNNNVVVIDEEKLGAMQAVVGNLDKNQLRARSRSVKDLIIEIPKGDAVAETNDSTSHSAHGSSASLGRQYRDRHQTNRLSPTSLGGIEAKEISSDSDDLNQDFSSLASGSPLNVNKKGSLAGRKPRTKRSKSTIGGVGGFGSFKKTGSVRQQPPVSPLSPSGVGRENSMFMAMSSSGLMKADTTSSSFIRAEQQKKSRTTTNADGTSSSQTGQKSPNTADLDLTTRQQQQQQDFLAQILQQQQRNNNNSFPPTPAPNNNNIALAASMRDQIHQMRQVQAELNLSAEEKSRLNTLRQRAADHSPIVRHKFEKRKTTIYSVLPYGLKKRVFPPPRDIRDAKDRTLTEPISKLLNQLLYKQDIDRVVQDHEKDTYVDEFSGKRKRRGSKFHYELVEDPESPIFVGTTKKPGFGDESDDEAEKIASFKFPVSPSSTPANKDDGKNSPDASPPPIDLMNQKGNHNNNNNEKRPAGRRNSLRVARKVILPPATTVLSKQQNNNTHLPSPTKENKRPSSKDSLNSRKSSSNNSKNSSPIRHLGTVVVPVSSDDHHATTDKVQNTSSSVPPPPLFSPPSLHHHNQNHNQSPSSFSSPSSAFMSKNQDHKPISSSLTTIGRDPTSPPKGSLVKNTTMINLNQRLTSQMQQRKPIAIEHRPTWNSATPPSKMVRKNSNINNPTSVVNKGLRFDSLHQNDDQQVEKEEEEEPPKVNAVNAWSRKRVF